MAGVELRRFLRDRSNIFFVFILPLLLVLVIGRQFGGDGPDGRVGLAGPDGALRAALIDRLEADGVAVDVAGADEVRERVARGRADVGVLLPDAARAALGAARDVRLEVISGTGRVAPAVRQRVRTAVSAVAAERRQVAALVGAGASVDDAVAALEAARRSTDRPSLRIVDVNDIAREFGGVSGFDVGAAAETLLFVFLASLAGSSTLIRARRDGVVGRTLAAPVTPGQTITGQAMGRLTIAIFQGGYIMIASAVLFAVDWGNVGLSLLVLASFSAVAAGAAMLIGSVIDNEGAASGAGVGFGLVFAALGGCMMPLEFFPSTLYAIAHVTPHAWAYEALAEVQRHDGSLADIAPELAVLVGMAALLLLLGGAALRRSLARPV
jgi:ABC-2 type transport system permease protein